MSFSTTSIAPPSLRSSNRLRRGLPLHPVCGHAQAISGVFSVASHSALQYLPDVVTHEQSGCEHFTAFSEPISFLPTSDQDRMIQVQMLVSRKECFCTERNTLRFAVLSPWFPLLCNGQSVSCGRLITYSHHQGRSEDRHVQGIERFRRKNTVCMVSNNHSGCGRLRALWLTLSHAPPIGRSHP
jgi:hypothetical protein